MALTLNSAFFNGFGPEFEAVLDLLADSPVRTLPEATSIPKPELLES